jgi:quinol monooxygenase YgiN
VGVGVELQRPLVPAAGRAWSGMAPTATVMRGRSKRTRAIHDGETEGSAGWFILTGNNAMIRAEGRTWRSASPMITMINVFTVDPANQQRLLDLLSRVTDELVGRAPGFISSTLYRSLDGSKVTMHAEWRSAEDYEAMRQDPRPLPFLEQALAIAKFEPGMYEAVQSFSPSGN